MLLYKTVKFLVLSGSKNLTLNGVLLLGALIAALHIYWWKTGTFHKYELGSLVPVFVIVALWLGWCSGAVWTIYSNWSTIGAQISPVTGIFIK